MDEKSTAEHLGMNDLGCIASLNFGSEYIEGMILGIRVGDTADILVNVGGWILTLKPEHVIKITQPWR